MKRLNSDQSGNMYLEYLIVMVFAGLMVVLVLGPKMGEKIVTEYQTRAMLLYSPTP